MGAVEYSNGNADGVPATIACLVYRTTRRVQRWTAGLKKSVKASENRHYASDRYSQLEGANLSAGYLKCLGHLVQNTACESENMELNDPTNSAYLDQTLMGVLVGPDGRTAIGYCDFMLKWEAPASNKEANGLALVVELFEAWIAPDFRERGCGTSLASCVSRAVHDSMGLVEAAAVWGRKKTAKYELTFEGDVVSQAGEQFLVTCLNRFEQDHGCLLEEEADYKPRLRPSSILYAANW